MQDVQEFESTKALHSKRYYKVKGLLGRENYECRCKNE